MPSVALLFGDYVDDPTQRVRTETYRHHSLVHLYPLRKIDRQVVYVQSRTRTLLRDTVDKDLHVFARKPVQGQPGIGAHAPRLAEFQSREL